MTDGRLSLVTGPAAEPVTLDEVKEHCRIASDGEDRLLARLVAAARLQVEAATRRALVTQTWDWKLDCWPEHGVCGFELPLPPLQSITSIAYLDVDGVTQTWAATNYQVSAPAGPIAERGRLALAYGIAYPVLRSEAVDAVRIRFVAGYGAALAVPEDLRTAVLFLVHEMYDRRAEVVLGGTPTPNVMAAKALCAPYASIRW